MSDLQIYYNSLAGSDYISCDCSRYDVQNYNITIETWLTKSQLQTLRDNITPGATGELYTILGKPRFYDKTWQGENTIKISPIDGSSTIDGMRSDKLIYVKNISTVPIDGPKGWLSVKIEGMISGSSL